MGSIDTDKTAIDTFMNLWQLQVPFYQIIADKTKDLCIAATKDRNIKCLVSCRVKETKSLEKKLYTRQKSQGHLYKDTEAIRNDIKDLAGVRIALYFPKQRKAVRRMINELFTVQEKKVIPEPPDGTGKATENNDSDEEHTEHTEDDEDDEDGPLDTLPQPFPGYCADHYHVYLKPQHCPTGTKPQANRIEIQVVSIIRHVWAEVEHDIVYKHLAVAGDVERQILDGLSGAIHLGECSLNQLYDCQRLDGPFETVHHLGSYLSQCMEVMADRPIEDPGDVYLLWQLLNVMGLNGRRRFRRVLETLDFSVHSKGLSPIRVGRETLRPSIVTYIMKTIVESANGKEKVAAQVQSRRRQMEERRYKLEVVIDSFVLVSDLFALVEWVALVMNTNGRTAWREVIVMVRWLHGEQPWEFYRKKVPLDRAGEDVIDQLWAHFNGHDQPLMQMVFSLAQLGVVKSCIADKARLAPALEQLIG